jgi:hypothetical protein
VGRRALPLLERVVASFQDRGEHVVTDPVMVLARSRQAFAGDEGDLEQLADRTETAGWLTCRASASSEAVIEPVGLTSKRKHDVLDEDVARRSPLKHANLNCLGRY